MKTICLFLAAVMLLSATIPMAMPSDALADNGKLYSGGAIDSSGRFSLTAVEFMEELISVMNSNTALSALDATFSALGDSSISLSPEFTYYYQDESFYILQYMGMEIGAVSFLKDGNPTSGSSNFDSVGVQIPNNSFISPFFLFNACCSAIFLTAPACLYEDALLLFASLTAKQKEYQSNEQYPYAEVSNELFEYSVESFLIDEAENTWQYLFIVSQI